MRRPSPTTGGRRGFPPERVQGALGLLNWTRSDLVQRAGVNAEELRLFIDYGVPMGVAADGAVKRVLLAKVSLSIEEGQPGVLLKRETMEALGPRRVGLRRLSHAEAEALTGDAGDDPFKRVADEVAGGGANGVRQEKAEEEHVAPVPSDAPKPLESHRGHGRPSALWTYRDAAGRVLRYVGRFDGADGKVVLPPTLWRSQGRLQWRWKGEPAPRPLYGLQGLASRPGDPVLVVEGEKTADAARKLFPAYVVATWPGGSKAVSKADWRPLAGREVTIWPDADEPGRSAASTVRNRLLQDGAASARVVTLSETLPDGWDLADAWPPGFGLTEAQGALERASAPAHEAIWPRGFEASPEGLWWAPPSDGRGEDAPRLWLCGAFQVVASARDEEGGSWSTVVEFADLDGRKKREIIGRGELAGDGVEVRRRLMDAGLPISSSRAARERLQAGLAGVICTNRVRLVASTGWKGGLYVLPHCTVGGTAGEGVIFRGRPGATHHGQAGSYSVWRDLVAGRASGNALLLFALSCAFAGPLMRQLGAEGGGFHIRGESSSGKTTLLRAAGSVWGGGGELGFAQSWRSTDNALEAVALAHNDGLLALDELRQLDPAAAGAAAYALAAGVAKSRLRADAEMRARPTWRVLILSAGEIGMGDLIRLARGKDKSYAGQELRLLDVPADMGAGQGAWQALHDAPGGAVFSERLNSATAKHYGHAGPLFLERLVAGGDDALAQVARYQVRFLEKVHRFDDTGQARRGAQRFALAAAAGELAIRFGVVPWCKGEAAAACATLFDRWGEGFGRNSAWEDREAVQRVRIFSNGMNTVVSAV